MGAKVVSVKDMTDRNKVLSHPTGQGTANFDPKLVSLGDSLVAVDRAALEKAQCKVVEAVTQVEQFHDLKMISTEKMIDKVTQLLVQARDECNACFGQLATILEELDDR